MAKQKLFYFIHADDIEELLEYNPHFKSLDDLFYSLTDEAILTIARKSSRSRVMSIDAFVACFNRQQTPNDFTYYVRVI